MKWFNDLDGEQKLIAWAIFWVAIVSIILIVGVVAYNINVVINHYQPPLAR